jgi:ABC-type microcin C transport system permease subunit YejE
MFDMFMNSVKLFFAGRLFRDGRAVLTQWLKGFGLSLVLLLLLGLLVSPLVGVVVASLVGGFAQPLLFKDLKYA